MSKIPTKRPRWLEMSDGLMWPMVMATIEILRNRTGPDVNINNVPHCAAIHLHDCLETSQQTNEKGKHSVAVCLVRQCVESLTIIELGLGNPDSTNHLIAAWMEGKKSNGELRKTLEKDVWANYGTGLWDESWGEFFGSLARAVQPYAHYSPELMGWQGSIRSGLINERYFVREIGVNTYDPVNASRITLLHSLIAWTLGRLLVENKLYPPALGDVERVRELGRELGSSPLLCGGKASWPEELWPYLFFREMPESF